MLRMDQGRRQHWSLQSRAHSSHEQVGNSQSAATAFAKPIGGCSIQPLERFVALINQLQVHVDTHVDDLRAHIDTCVNEFYDQCQHMDECLTVVESWVSTHAVHAPSLFPKETNQARLGFHALHFGAFVMACLYIDIIYFDVFWMSLYVLDVVFTTFMILHFQHILASITVYGALCHFCDKKVRWSFLFWVEVMFGEFWWLVTKLTIYNKIVGLWHSLFIVWLFFLLHTAFHG